MLIERDLDSQDREQRLKRQKIRVIIAEIIMTLSVIIIVVVATLLAMGYTLTKDGSVEQTGLLQLRTMPTGATVDIDGEVQFSRSNMSKSLSPATTHHLKLTRDGYDSWEKDITVTSGRVTRIYYPRLFLEDREISILADFSTADLSPQESAEVTTETNAETANENSTAEATAESIEPTEESAEETSDESPKPLLFFLIATNRQTALLAYQDDPIWYTTDLNSDTLKWTTIDGTDFWSTSNPLGTIDSTTFSEDGNKLLLSTTYSDKTYWYLLDLQDINKSLNLTTTFGLDFDKVTLASDSADSLFAVENGNLHEINVADKALSRILITKVSEFNNLDDLIVYVQQQDDGLSVGTYRNGEDSGVIIFSTDGTLPVHASIASYYNDEYLAASIGTQIKIYSGKFPNYSENQGDISNTLPQVAELELTFTPEQISVSPESEYFLATSGTSVGVVELEQLTLSDYIVETGIHWLDDAMFYTVASGSLTVMDFDHTNLRTLATSASSTTPATITENNKYLYYLNTQNQLVREKIIS